METPEFQQITKAVARIAANQGMNYNDFLHTMREAFLNAALDAAEGNQSHAAKRFGVHRNTIIRMLQERRTA